MRKLYIGILASALLHGPTGSGFCFDAPEITRMIQEGVLYGIEVPERTIASGLIEAVRTRSVGCCIPQYYSFGYLCRHALLVPISDSLPPDPDNPEHRARFVPVMALPAYRLSYVQHRLGSQLGENECWRYAFEFAKADEPGLKAALEISIPDRLHDADVYPRYGDKYTLPELKAMIMTTYEMDNRRSSYSELYAAYDDTYDGVRIKVYHIAEDANSNECVFARSESVPKDTGYNISLTSILGCDEDSEIRSKLEGLRRLGWVKIFETEGLTYKFRELVGYMFDIADHINRSSQPCPIIPMISPEGIVPVIPISLQNMIVS